METIKINANTQRELLDATILAEKLWPILRKRIEEGKIRAEDSFLGNFYWTGVLMLPDSTAIPDVRIKIDAMGTWFLIQKAAK